MTEFISRNVEIFAIIASILVALAIIVAAMRSTGPSQYVLPKWRSVVSAIGLSAAVADALLWVTLHAIWIGGFQTALGVEWVRYNLEAEGFRPVLLWWRIGVWLGILAIVASSLGKGWLRKWGVIVGVVTFVVWLFRGHS